MRRRTLKRLSPKCHRVQIRNPRCSQSRCHPLWGETIQISCSSLIQESKLSSVPTWIEFFNQRWHRVGDRVSSNEEVVSQIPPWTFQNTETKKKRFYISIWIHPWLLVWLWYPERRPLARHPQRPLASPEVCASALWQQNRSGWAWGWSGW